MRARHTLGDVHEIMMRRRDEMSPSRSTVEHAWRSASDVGALLVGRREAEGHPSREDGEEEESLFRALRI